MRAGRVVAHVHRPEGSLEPWLIAIIAVVKVVGLGPADYEIPVTCEEVGRPVYRIAP